MGYALDDPTVVDAVLLVMVEGAEGTPLEVCRGFLCGFCVVFFYTSPNLICV
jgi:hypothetical protein